MVSQDHIIYFFSGLGADERVFKYLVITAAKKVHIKWVKPQKSDSISSYCDRLASQIDQTRPAVFVGVSFGGIVAQEMAKKFTCLKLIIISSIKSEKEMDWKMKLVKKLKLRKLVPHKMLSFINKFTSPIAMGTQNKEEKELLEAINRDSDPDFVSWAIDQVLEWENPDPYSPITHIHGTRDKVFPIEPIRNCIPIEGGEHFMVVSKAKEISSVINKMLS